ncbi:hypothetical protein M2103_000133 [Ereboglobus sp. PH5-5]|nr:hypothetical protein [Ereboglobus sp. PH5-5]
MMFRVGAHLACVLVVARFVHTLAHSLSHNTNVYELLDFGRANPPGEPFTASAHPEGSPYPE